jgi:hypothetical protein
VRLAGGKRVNGLRHDEEPPARDHQPAAPASSVPVHHDLPTEASIRCAGTAPATEHPEAVDDPRLDARVRRPVLLEGPSLPTTREPPSTPKTFGFVVSILRWAMAEAVAFYGYLLGNQGAPDSWTIPFHVVAVALLVIYAPWYGSDESNPVS